MAHDAWLRQVIQDLVEPDLVEDVVQETFLAAWLKGQDNTVHNLPGFLRRVGRNLALKHRRREGRRRRREQQAAKDEALPSTGQMLERLQAHRQLTTAVSELGEPYRTTILLRYFEGLTPKQIAVRQGVPASTVRTQLERGLAQLRGRLGGTDLRALAALFLWPEWQAGAAGSAGSTTPIATKLAATLFSGAVFMSVHLKSSVLVAVLLVLAGGGIWYWDPLAVDLPTDAGSPLSGTVAAAEQEPEATDRQPLDTSEVGNAAAVKPSSTAAVLRGRVLDTRGVPIAGVEVLVDREDAADAEFDDVLRLKPQQNPQLLAQAVTDQGGHFALPAHKLTKDIEVDARLGEAYVPLWLSVPERESWDREEVLVVAAQKMSLRGQVVDEDGVGIPGARVSANVPQPVGFPLSLDNAQTMALGQATTNARGDFWLPKLPDTAGLELWVLATGFDIGIADRQDDQRRIVLKRVRSDTNLYRIHGTVVDKGMRIVEGAMVRVGNKETHTDSRGHFNLAFKMLHEDTHLFVGKKGHSPRTYDQHLEAFRTGKKKEAVVVLTLGDTPKQITGRVVDPTGEPVPGLVVVLKDVMFLSFYQTAEDLALGRKSKLDSSEGSPMMIDARTDAEGGFSVGGLAPRPYRLHIFDPKTLVAIMTAPIAAGSEDVEVRFPKDGIHEELRGVVRSSSGQPLADVQVNCTLQMFKSDVIQSWAPGDITRTDAAGCFVLKRVPQTGVHLNVCGDDVMDYRVPVETAGSAPELVLVPPLRCHFRIRDARPDADAIRLLDADGNVLMIQKKSGQTSMGAREWKLRRGRTPSLAVSEVARTLVYLRKGKELERKPVRLVPRQINDLQ